MSKQTIIDLGKVGITVSLNPWDMGVSYERMTMVYHSSSGDCYISLKDNIGVDPLNDNTGTWVKTTEHGHSLYEIAVEQGSFVGTEQQFVQQYTNAVANMEAAFNEWNTITKPAAVKATDDAILAKINADIATTFANEQGTRALEIADLANPVLDNLQLIQATALEAQTSAENAAQSAEQSAQSAADAQSNLQDIYDKIDEVGEESVAIAALQNEVTNLQTDKFDKSDVVQETGDNEDKVMSQKAVTDAYGSIEDNPEFINVVTDSEGKILEAIKEDGTKYFPNKIQQGEVYSEITNNPEYLFVYTDSTDKMLFGIKTDGSVEFQKGIPTPIKNELERLENTLNALTGENLSDAIENVKEILSFLEDIKDNEKLIEKLNLINERLNNLEDKTEELDHTENPEYIDVTLDADGKILEGIKSDGTKYFPNKIRQGEISTEIIDNPEYSEVTLDASGKVIEGLTKEGQKYLAKPSNQDEIIQSQVTNQEERLEVVEDKTQDLSHTVNPEFLEVTLDKDDKIIEGIKKDGTKYFANKVQQGSILTEFSDNPEYVEITIDSNNKVIEGITNDGKKILAYPTNQDDKLQQQIDEFPIDTINNPEFIDITLDAENKIVDGIKKDGTKYFATKINHKGTEYNVIDNPEYSEVILDGKDRIIECTTNAGEKQINTPYNFNRKVTFNDEIEMSEKGQSSIINIIKNSGIKFDCCVDWSEATAIEIPRPTKCALVKITGTIPTSKFNDNPGYLEFWDMSGNYFKKKIIWNLQGASSLSYVKKNFGFDLLNEDDSEFTVKFGDWPTQDSFHLKGNGNDFLAISSYIPYRWQTLISESRPEYNQYPYERIRNYSNQTAAEALLGGDGNIEDDFKPSAKCHPDGFPVMLYLNDIPWGLYFMNLKKSKEVYNVTKNSDDASQMCYNSDISTFGFMNRFNGRYWKVLVQQLTDTTGIDKWDENTVYQVGDIVWDEETFDFEINGNTSAVTIRRKFECILATNSSYYAIRHNTTKPQSAWINSIEVRNPKEMIAKQTDGSFTQYNVDSPSDYNLAGYCDYTHEPITADDLAAAIAYNKATKNDKYPFNEDNQKIGKMKPKNWEKACKRSVKVREKLELRSKLIPVMRFMTDTNISEWGFSSKAEAVKAIFEEYYDLPFIIDYFIIDNLIAFMDNIVNNNIYLLYDGKHMNSTLYDTDCCLFDGIFGPGIQAYPSTSVRSTLYTSTYTYMGILHDYYLPEIKTRWAELRNNGVISYETFCKLVDEHIAAIGVDNLIEEKRLWGIITMHRPAAYWLMPCGNCLIGEDEDGLPIHYFDESNNTEISDCETWEEGKSYVSGTKVNYNGHNYSCVWNHTSSADKRPDKAKSYGNPNLGGFYDTPRKRKEWVRQRIINLDTKFGYTSNN